MAEPKTKRNKGSVDDFISTITDAQQQDDARQLVQIFSEVSGEPPVMWGSSIIGFGTYHYTYASGREGDWMATGFSPRKQNLTLYIMDGFTDYQALLEKLGPHSTGKSCLYIKRLSDVDLDTLKQLITRSIDYVTSNLDTTQ